MLPCVLVLAVSGCVDAGESTHVAVLVLAVSGCVDAGKSTLVAVLTHGAEGAPMLETGQGTARMSVRA